MKVDATITDVVLTTATKTNLKSDQVLTILNKYYAGITHIIENEPPSVIKIDFFGKLIYNNAWKAKVDSIKKQKQENEII
jgi:hypothetical protein